VKERAREGVGGREDSEGVNFGRKGGPGTSAKTAVTQHAIFFQRFSTCYFFFQHAIFHFNMLFFSCIIFNMLFFAGPFFNMLFHLLNMLFFPAAITTNVKRTEKVH
jgi:hypothetical protein